MRALARLLARLEDAFLAGLLLAMIGLAVLQIVLRNGFDTGLPWGESLLRMLVLWVAFVGSTVATREGRHVRIDALVRLFPEPLRAATDRIGDLVVAGLCGVLAWYGLALVRLEYADGFEAFAGVPVWVTELVIPVAFAVMGLRHLLQAIAGRPSLAGDGPR
ncbi:MAG: TRAP transporter small permease [Pseudomonadales bacterium]|nr:TRAP transporter small permease [Pseudomonadales bacterium]